MTTRASPEAGPTDPILRWLLDSDPSLRWQVERDLVGAPAQEWEATRALVPTQGFGARLLARQDADGQWAGGAYFPAQMPPNETAQPWTATTWSLAHLREWGVPAEALLEDTAGLLDRNSRWEYDDLPYWGGEVDACINALTLANGAWLGADVSAIARWFPAHQMAEGGWNCLWVEGSTRASFHSTISSLVGILDYEQRTGGDPELTAARHAAQEYLLRRRLLYRLATGERHDAWVTHLAYPFRATYSALRAVDYFRAAHLHDHGDGAAPDPRLSDAIDTIRAARDPDGRWHQQVRHGGQAWFEVDAAPGQPSRWLTFFALRALGWWDHAAHPVGAPA